MKRISKPFGAKSKLIKRQPQSQETKIVGSSRHKPRRYGLSCNKIGMAVTRRFFFFNKQKGRPPGTCVPSGVYRRQFGNREQDLQGKDKMAAEGSPKTAQKPPKQPQTAPTTLLS